MLDRLPQSILGKAFQGEVVDQNSNDESVTVLMDRIKTETTKLESLLKVRKQKKTIEDDTMVKAIKMTTSKSRLT